MTTILQNISNISAHVTIEGLESDVGDKGYISGVPPGGTITIPDITKGCGILTIYDDKKTRVWKGPVPLRTTINIDPVTQKVTYPDGEIPGVCEKSAGNSSTRWDQKICMGPNIKLSLAGMMLTIIGSFINLYNGGSKRIGSVLMIVGFMLMAFSFFGSL
jgi:hypothetical protein